MEPNNVAAENYKVVETSTPAPIAPGNIGIMFERVNSPALLHDIEVEEGAEIVKLVVGSFKLERAEGQLWTDVFKAIPVAAGMFVNLHVKNLTDVTRGFVGRIRLSEQPAPLPEVEVAVQPAVQVFQPMPPPQTFQPPSGFQPPIAQGFPQQQPSRPAYSGGQTSVHRGPRRQPIQAEQSALASPLARNQAGMNRPQNSVRRPGQLMELLPPLIGKPDAAKHQVMAAGSPRPGVNGNSGPIGPRHGIGPFPNTNQSIPSRRSKSIVENVRPRVERHMRRASAPAPEVIDAVLTDDSEVNVNLDSVSAEMVLSHHDEETTPTTRHESTPEGLDMVLPNEEQKAVVFLKGHAFALRDMLALRTPLNGSFRPAILHAMTQAMTHNGAFAGGVQEIVVLLTVEQIAALARIMRAGRGTLFAPETPALAEAFQKAIAFDEVSAQARMQRRTNPENYLRPSGREDTTIT